MVIPRNKRYSFSPDTTCNKCGAPFSVEDIIEEPVYGEEGELEEPAIYLYFPTCNCSPKEKET